MLNPTQFQAKEEKVQVADDSLSEADPLSEWHPLSEAYSLLSGLGNFRRGSVRDVLAQHTTSLPSEDIVSSSAQHTQSR